ncbi:discoidin domain-containing protein [Streptosporangium sp. NPDC050855]|uniref:discoidin domain-containing protein n=1 Tax=Streptosporangium sp. NPDC050855 TaxID=3366194 RepID=UPI0037BE037D
MTTSDRSPTRPHRLGGRAMTVLAILLAALCWTGAQAPPAARGAAVPEQSSNVHLFYYPWYGNPQVSGGWRHWEQGGHTPPDDIGADLYPTLGAYDSADHAGAVTRHMQWIKQAGVGVIVYSWWGVGGPEDRIAQGVLDAAARHGIKVAWHLEPYGGRTAASTVADIRYINDRYGSHPAFYRSAEHGGRAAFYVFESLRITDWSALDQVTANNIVLAQTTDTSKIAHFSGMYTYDGIAGTTAPGWADASAYARRNNLIWAPSVAPGYIDDRAVPGNTTPTLGRANGATYDLEWSNALDPAKGGLPTWVSVTSFNEWHEGSSIEPADSTPPAGFGYQTYEGAYGRTGAAAETAYLDRTKYWATEFETRRAGGQGDTRPPTAPGAARAVPASSTSVTVGWTASTDDVGVTGYDVHREAGAVDPLVGSTTGTSLTVTGLTPSTAYSFYVVARDAARNTSPPSGTVTATTGPPAGCSPNTGDMARGRPVVASGVTQNYVAANAVDGDASTYWESVNHAFPQSVTVDLCAQAQAGRVVLRVPPAAAWSRRTQTLSVLGSADGTSFTTLAGSRGHVFDPATGNTVTVTFPAAAVRYVRVTVTGNTGWPAAQLSSFEVHRP